MPTKYGFFNTTFSAANAVAGSVEHSQLTSNATGVFWLELRPEESGRAVLQWLNWEGELQSLTSSQYSVRSRVYEYGGKSWCLLEPTAHNDLQCKEASKLPLVAFVNNDDQQIWLQELCSDEPLQLTQDKRCRYGDLLGDSKRQRIIAIQEKATSDPTQPEHALVSICVKTGQVTDLHRGQDFYASPSLSKSSCQLAWISWRHPDMPWVETELYLTDLTEEGTPLRDRVVSDPKMDACSPKQSMQQPRFFNDGSIGVISDSSGWWNLYRYQVDNTAASGSADDKYSTWQKEALWPLQAEFGIAQWQLGESTWMSFTDHVNHSRERCLVATYHQYGKGYLALHHVASHTTTLLATEYTLFRHISCLNGKIYCIAFSDTHTSAVVEINPERPPSTQVRVLTGNKSIQEIDKLSSPQSITYPVANEVSHGFLYLPELIPGTVDKPPLLVFTHGGPTATTYSTLNPKIQYWTQRGFAVIDLNYRGSAGFGREYRLRLAGEWGVIDVEDAVAAADYLAEQGLVDGVNVFIRGGSAGGYTTLCALAFSDRFRGGASYYGVSDPITLTADTHKFESHYLDWLIGDPDQHSAIYRERSPLLAADQISCPMIFFQGELDKVVVPDQTERMVSALQNRGMIVEYHSYPEEQHGFRKSENQIHSLDAECSFYQKLLNS